MSAALKIPVNHEETFEGPLGTLRTHKTLALTGAEARANRYALQAAARAVLLWHKGPDAFKARSLRVIKCLRVPIASQVSVWRRELDSSPTRAYFTGLCLCGSVWTCPVCTAKVTEARRIELDMAVNNWKKSGGHMALLTLTFPHIASDSLRSMVPKFTKALQYFIKWRAGRDWSTRLGIQHRVRAVEFTHGQNGWHPHVHILLFLDKPLQDQSTDTLVKHWQKCCTTAGLREPSAEHGVDLRDGTYAAQYVGKWGLAHELTKANTKQGREGSRTPWDFLKEVLATGDLSQAYPFVAYAVATKGVRQLCWSKGAREALGLGLEVSDEDLSGEEITPEDLYLCSLRLYEWRLVLAYENGRALLLQHAEERGEAGVRTFVLYLRRKCINHSQG